MKFFVDTANLEAIREINDLGLLDGVTTNPSLMAKEGIRGEEAIFEHYQRIARMVSGDVSAEVISTDFSGMVEEGKRLASIADNIVVKVPMIREGVRAIRYFHDEGIRTNCTLVFTAAQAIIAAKAGANYVSPFMGRLDDLSNEGIDLIRQIVNIYTNYGMETEVLAASIRSTLHMVQCAEAGADVATCPPAVILQMMNHPLTDIGLERFLSDYRKSQQ